MTRDPILPADPPSVSAHDREEGLVFAPKYGPDGLVTVVTLAAADGAILMVAHMNAQALRLTLETGIVHYWSRSKGTIWRKGDTSGQRQKLLELLVDCDQDALVAKVEVEGDGGACHTGRRSCFYRRVTADGAGLAFVSR
ncbi:MAG: phosphoribosyl-AMP cyclohydrolase [Hyphomicrobiales bacterium]|nr:phosphoribosyl-AMP cyclohydrolase [Hyphomicrobiales bacterium]